MINNAMIKMGTYISLKWLKPFLTIGFMLVIFCTQAQSEKNNNFRKTMYPVYSNDLYNPFPENILNNVVYNTCNGILILEIKEPGLGEFSLSIVGNDNKTIVSDTIISNGKNILKTYDLSEFEDKEVTISVKHGEKSLVQKRVI